MQVSTSSAVAQSDDPYSYCQHSEDKEDIVHETGPLSEAEADGDHGADYSEFSCLVKVFVPIFLFIFLIYA